MEVKGERKVREIDPQRTLFKALAVLAMLVISISSMCYIGWLLWTLPAKK